MQGNTAEWQQAMRLFEAWLGSDADAQASLMARLRQQDAQAGSQLATQLARLIAADQQATGAAGFVAQGHAHAGRRLGAWTLVEPVGRGGAGEVWRASRSDGLHHGQAAIKLLGPTPAGSQAPERFAREAEFLARLNHPGIAKLLDVGLAPASDTDPTPTLRYLVLEFVDGQPLDRWCDQRRLGLAERLRLFLQVCDAVSYAHGQLVVHRDLKPANVMVSEPGHVRLLDFGVAKLLDDAGAPAELTRHGAAGLTPEYAAPEQVQAGAITTATDVYALGVMLFRLLSGRRPYGQAGDPPAALARHIVETEPRRLDRADPESADPAAQAEPQRLAEARGLSPARLNQALAGDLAWIVARALHKAPADRYASVQALADDVLRHLNHEPVSARAPSWRYRSARFVRRHRAAVAAAAATSLAVVAGVSATAWQAREARHQAALAQQQARMAQEQARLADGMRDFVFEMFNTARVGGSQPAPGGEVSVRDMLRATNRRLLSDTTLPSATHRELLNQMAQANVNNNLPEEAVLLARHAVQLARREPARACEGLAHAEYELATLLEFIGQTGEAETLWRDAVVQCEPAAGQAAPETLVLSLIRLGKSATRRGDPRAALPDQQRAAALMQAHHPKHGQRFLAGLGLAHTLAVLARYDSAERTLKEAQALAAESDTLRNFGEAAARMALGALYRRMARHAEAPLPLRQALPQAQADLGPRASNTGLLLIELAMAEHQMGNDPQAREHLALADSIASERPVGGLYPAADKVLMARAWMGLLAGDLAAATGPARRVAEHLAAGPAVEAAEAWLVLAELELLAGRAAAAVATAERALARATQSLGDEALLARQAWALLGRAQAELALRAGPGAGASPGPQPGHRAAAAAALARALAPLPSSDGASAPAWGLLRADALLAQAQLRLAEQPRQALALIDQALASLPADDGSRRHGLSRAQAWRQQAEALQATGEPAAAQAALQRARQRLAPGQVPGSPRLLALQRLQNGWAGSPAPQATRRAS